MGVVELRKTLQVACSSKEGDMHLRPDPDFQDFALDCIRLSNQEKSPRLRHRLLTLAREWMHAAMHQRGAQITSREYRTNGRKLRRAMVRYGYQRSDERIRQRPHGGGDR